VLPARKTSGLRMVLDAITGTVVCAWLALIGVLLASLWPHPLVMMVGLAVAAGWVARAWSLVGAVVGLLAAASVFSCALFPPIGSFFVASEDGRTALFWMLAAGLVNAYVLARPGNLRQYARRGDL
jgi:K+-sensing histidine kinase KdpD